MQDVDHRLVAFVTWLAGTAAVLVTLVVPLSYFSLSFSALSSATQATAMIESEMAEQIISSLPDLWKYQTVRLDQALARHAQHMGLQRVVIVDLRNDVVAEHGRHPPWPVLSRSIELFESGTAV